MKRIWIVLFTLFLAGSAFAAEGLTVVKVGPVGEVSTLAEANEIRIIFSEPMVVLGKIPSPVVAPWFHLAPSVPGAFRWSGTTTLIFTPEARHPLPFATTFNVTVDKSAASAAGHQLSKQYAFSFTTPTIRLVSTNWYRKSDRFDGAVVILLKFNQPVVGQEIGEHLQLRYQAHPFEEPLFPADGLAILKTREPQAEAAWQAKLAKARAAASATSTVLGFITTEWDKKRYPASSSLVAFETKPGIPPGSWIEVVLDEKLGGAADKASAGIRQNYTVELPPTFFVEKVECSEKCNPDYYHGIEFRAPGGIKTTELRRALTVWDVTDPKHETKLTAATKKGDDENERDWSSSFSLDELGYTVEPAHSYLLRIDPTLVANDGQTLGYTWLAGQQYWHRGAFISFGDGHGVWESTGGAVLPFSARNYQDVTQWVAPLKPEELMPTIVRLQKTSFVEPPPGQPKPRKLAPALDRIQSYGLNVSSALNAKGFGLAWAAARPGTPTPLTAEFSRDIRATIVQVTNLGISVKDSPQNTLIFVTRLDDAAPVADATVSIRTADNAVFWTGRTDAHGIAMAPNTDLRRKKVVPKPAAENAQPADAQSEDESSDWEALSELHFLVTAEKDGDYAYVASDWNEGISSWDLGVDFNLSEAQPLLRGTVFADRGVYKLGEEAHLKAVLRTDTPSGMKLLPAGTKVTLSIIDGHSKEVDHRTITLNEWSSAEAVFKVPSDGVLGNYNIVAKIEGQRGTADGTFLVAAYRRPDFRVDAKLSGDPPVAGTKLTATIDARYLFGAPMAGRDVKWSYSRHFSSEVPAAILERFPEERYSFLGVDTDEEVERGVIAISSKETKVSAKGQLKLTLDTVLDAGQPYDYTIEGVVTDVSRQKIAGRASLLISPAPWYIAVKTPPYFAEASKGFDTEIAAVGLDGKPVAGVKVTVALERIQWTSVRKAEGNGFYTWESTKKEIDAGSWPVTSTSAVSPMHIPLAEGGEYRLVATAGDDAGRTTKTVIWFYAVGSGYTAWERSDTNHIELVPEKKTWKPGDTARIMVKSPWEHATALLTTEREGVRTSRQFAITSTQQTISVPITEADIPNVFVSVLLVKGRTKEAVTEDSSDPGKPAFRLGYVALDVVDATKRLSVALKANRDEYRPASKARIDVDVKDAQGKPSRSELTLWAVDYGVLSLTSYRTPQIIDSVYLRKALQVANEDSRQKIISRRVLVPKGGGEGGGGGRDSGPGTLRKDFRVLAFWLGSVETDKNGHAKADVVLPESLTTYRIMAVASDKASRFGWKDTEIKVNKPVLLTPAFPRFLAVGDKAFFGAVVHSQLKTKGIATVTVKSLDPAMLELTSPTTSMVEVGENGAAEVRFNAVARATGNARLQMSVKLERESDAFEDVIPVRVFASPETVAAYGEARPDATETLQIPQNVIPSIGGLHIDLSSTMMVGLGEGARYLVDYPYGCAEQRSSSALALMLASDLGAAFHLEGIDAPRAHVLAQSTLHELEKFQCDGGGFSFWAGECTSVSPYLTSYVTHVMQQGKKLGYTTNAEVMNKAYGYLEQELSKQQPVNEGWWPSYTAWQAFSVKVLVEGGRNADSHLNRLMGYVDRMPVFALSYLADAMSVTKDPRVADLRRRITNAIQPEGGSAHVQELDDRYLPYFWSSNTRSTAIVLGNLVRSGQDEQLVKRMVRWLMAVRKGGRWGNTQENAWAMESLVDYYHRYESETPDFTGKAALGAEMIAQGEFHGRSAAAKSSDLSMAQILTKGEAGKQIPLTFRREGAAGTLFYATRLRYASDSVIHEPLDAGFKVERKYVLQGSRADVRTFKAGDLVSVTLTIRNTKERQFVAVMDPIPAGTEPVESWFATTASEMVAKQNEANTDSWTDWWTRGGFDHIERHDDHVNLFATRLGEGTHTYTYLVRATTTGTFTAAPTHVEEMYEPEVFGRTATDVVDVTK